MLLKKQLLHKFRIKKCMHQLYMLQHLKFENIQAKKKKRLHQLGYIYICYNVSYMCSLH